MEMFGWIVAGLLALVVIGMLVFVWRSFPRGPFM